MVVQIHEEWTHQLKLGEGSFYGPGATVLRIIGSDRMWDPVDMGGVNPACNFFIEKMSSGYLSYATLDDS